MSLNLGSLLTTVFGASGSGASETEVALATQVVGAVVGNNSLTALNTASVSAIKSLVTEADNGIDQLQASFTKFEASQPLVTNGIQLAVALAKSQGLSIPSEDIVQTHIKAAIADVAAIFGVTAPATTAAPAAPATA
jgi:hypothetical protein